MNEQKEGFPVSIGKHPETMLRRLMAALRVNLELSISNGNYTNYRFRKFI